MRLFFAIKTLGLSGGGAERVLRDLTGLLANRGHAVRVASFDAPGTRAFYDLDPAVEWSPLGIGDINRRTSLTEAAGRIARLRKEATGMKPDVAVGFMHSAYIPLGSALFGTGIPLIASEHIAFAHYDSRPLQRWVLRLAPRLSVAMTVISRAVRDGFPSSLQRKMVVMPNPVSVKGEGRANVTGKVGAAKILLAVGRLESQKDHKSLIAAFGRIASAFPDWRLRIVGEGELRPELEAQVRDLGLYQTVSLPGATSDVAVEYVSAQLFAMPSTYESFGLTTAEALAHGLPVIGFADCPGTNELVVDGVNGCLVRGPDRVAVLAEGLATLMSSPEERERMSDAAPASINAFAPERIADRWEGLLTHVAARRPVGGFDLTG